MKYSVILLTSMLTCTGCTTLALERQTLSQAASPTDLRYQEALDNLALVARDPYALPAYSSIFAGTAQITDTAQLASNTAIGPGAAMQTINPQFTRAVLGNWTLDPINVPEKLEAMRCVCRWVICGQEFACRDCLGLLLSPEQMLLALEKAHVAPQAVDYRERHFGVYDRMTKLPHDWLRKGCRRDVPVKARYKAHSGDTWVWVMPEDLKGLADFSLILQDIARVDINSPTLLIIRTPPSDFVFPTTATKDKVPPCAVSSPVTSSGVIAEVSVDRCGNLKPDTPYYRYRVENMGSDANLRSVISAAAAGLH